MHFQLLHVFIFIATCESARILGVIPTPSFSHQVVFRPIWNELSRRGHDVVVITTDPQNNPDLNITEIDTSIAYEIWNNNQMIKVFNENKFNIFKIADMMMNGTLELNKQQLLQPGVQNILRNKSEHFDLVIAEYLVPIMFGFSERFKCPYVGVISFDMMNQYHTLLGNPSHPVLYPDVAMLGFYGQLNFWQRLASVGFVVVNKLLGIFPDAFIKNPVLKLFMEEHFGKDVPPILDIIKNVSIVLINENPVFNRRPLGPSFVLFGGGAHLTPPKPLPQDLKEYLDGAKNGFIYFSLGTNVNKEMFTPDKRQLVLDVFKELPYKVLWKFEVTDISDLPDNVKLAAWLPQQDILMHPKIKLFITQGGLQSSEEAIFSHVPIVGIPQFGDQYINVKRIDEIGGGVYLDKDSLTKEILKEAILEVIDNPKYKQNMIELADLLKDQPMTGIDKAIWWIEYVIRHKGASHFKNPAMDLPSYQYYMFDVLGFFLAVISIVLFIFYKIVLLVKKLFARLFKSSSRKIKSQ